VSRLAFTVLIALLVAAPAQARKTLLGSTLEAQANHALSQGADTAYWHARLRDGHPIRAPRDGQVLSIRLKGTAIRPKGAPDPLTLIHFQTLEPWGRGGDMRVMLTSGPFYGPINGPRNGITTYRPENLCIRRGGALAFNTIGGFNPPWYPNGIPWGIFSHVRGSHAARFTGDNATNNGSKLRNPKRERNAELLMQFTLGTGDDLGVPCRNFFRAEG
jgi:hypothetical protein